jgi:hypothetical protein
MLADNELPAENLYQYTNGFNSCFLCYLGYLGSEKQKEILRIKFEVQKHHGEFMRNFNRAIRTLDMIKTGASISYYEDALKRICRSLDERIKWSQKFNRHPYLRLSTESSEKNPSLALGNSYYGELVKLRFLTLANIPSSGFTPEISFEESFNIVKGNLEYLKDTMNSLILMFSTPPIQYKEGGISKIPIFENALEFEASVKRLYFYQFRSYKN